jgi:guanine deaminase
MNAFPAHGPFAIHATVIHSTSPTTIECQPNHLLIISASGEVAHSIPHPSTDEGDIRSTLKSLSLSSLPLVVLPWPRHFLLPGLIDTHVHAPQHCMRSLGSAQGMHILEWLDQITFPQEARFSDTQYARNVYGRAVATGLNNGITTACYFASLHTEATKVLADVALERGQRAFVGKVCMDNQQTNPEYYREATTETSLKGTQEVIDHLKAIDPRGHLVRPIVTPRFAISCTQDCLAGLGEILDRERDAYGGAGILSQTHFCEAEQEVSTTLQMYPNFKSEVDLYQHYGQFNSRSVLAHCTIITHEEILAMQQAQVGVAHCPVSNSTVGGGFMAAPVKKFLDLGMKVGLGTDSGGGFSSSLLDVMRMAVVVGNAREVMSSGKEGRLGLEEILWMSTQGGADVLNLGDKIGSFHAGKKFDAIIVDTLQSAGGGLLGAMAEVEEEEPWKQVLEKFIMTADDRNMIGVYVNGTRVK